MLTPLCQPDKPPPTWNAQCIQTAEDVVGEQTATHQMWFVYIFRPFSHVGKSSLPFCAICIFTLFSRPYNTRFFASFALYGVTPQ